MKQFEGSQESFPWPQGEKDLKKIQAGKNYLQTKERIGLTITPINCTSSFSSFIWLFCGALDEGRLLSSLFLIDKHPKYPTTLSIQSASLQKDLKCTLPPLRVVHSPLKVRCIWQQSVCQHWASSQVGISNYLLEIYGITPQLPSPSDRKRIQ